MHAEGQRFESVILHFSLLLGITIYDILYTRNVKLSKQKLEVYIIPHLLLSATIIKKVIKGAWRMPWLSEAMKDVISCDKLRGGANNH